MILFNNRFRLCELFGIPIYVDFSFAILLLIFVTSARTFSEGMTEAILLAFSVIAHEFGHSLTARAFGYQTNDITISLLGGCASLISLPRKAWQELLTAIAGPFVSFVLSGMIGSIPAWALAVITALTGALMISSVPYGNLKTIKKGCMNKPKLYGLLTFMISMLVLERGTGMLINIAIYLVSGIVHFDWGKWLSLPEPVESEQQN